MTPGSSSLISSSISGKPPTPVKKMNSLNESGGGGDIIKKDIKKMEASPRKSPRVVGSEAKGKGRNSPGKGVSGKAVKKTSPRKASVKTPDKKKEMNEVSTSESESEASGAIFDDYSELCDRVAKTMYFTKTRPPVTPRPSLPLTILAVDTFSKYARKDTLEFLDIDMAAEIGRNACVSPTALVFALVYLERLSVNNPGYLKTVKPSELFVVSLLSLRLIINMLVASKFVQDDGEDLGIFNDEWATSANMELRKVNQLELEFLTAIDWNINIGKEEYDRALKNTEEKIALYQGAKRGWFTYTEIQSLTNSHLAWNTIVPILYERVVEVVSGICVMYTTFFATLITSSVLAPYLLSVSKVVLLSSVTNSLLTGSAMSSCPEDVSNASIPMSQDINIRMQTRPSIPNIGYVPAEHMFASLEDEENKTESTDLDDKFGENWRQEVSNALLHHRRGYETATANYGYSFKCESSYCREYPKDEAIRKVQQVLENLLHSSNKMPNYMKPPKRQFQPNGALHCVSSGGLCPVY